MAIYKKGTTQAQKIKSIIIKIVLLVLFSIPIYKIGKKLLSYAPEKKATMLLLHLFHYHVYFKTHMMEAFL